MEDIKLSKFHRLNEEVVYLSLENFIDKVNNRKIFVYDIDCINKNGKCAIFDCVNADTKKCVSYIIKANNVYDTFAKVYNAVEDSVWESYVYHNALGYKFFTKYKSLRENIGIDTINEINDLPLEENDLYHFSFCVDKNIDMLQTGENAKGFCKVSYYKNEDLKDMKTILKEYIDKSNCIRGNYLLEIAETIPCKERPYKIFLYGADDSSYTKTYRTLKEVKEVILNLKIFDKIYTENFIEEYKFIFTN